MVKKKSNEEEKIQSSKNKKINFQNYWAIAAIVLGILLIISLIYNNIKSDSISVSSKVVGENVIAFLNSQTTGGVELVNVTEKDGLYLVTISFNGQKYPFYATKDGKNFIPEIVPLTGQAVKSQPQTPAQTQTQEIPKSDRPQVELFVMSHCPYGTQAEKGIIPVVKLLGDKIDFKLRFVYYAMHPSAGEVQEELRQYCIQKEQENKLIPYLECFLDKGNSDDCLNKANIDKTKLDKCYSETDKQFDVIKNLEDKSSWLSGQFPKFNIDLDANEEYGIAGSPSLVINKQEVSSARDSASLLNLICSAFNNAPTECSEKLSSAAPSPGFGYSTTTASTDATCG